MNRTRIWDLPTRLFHWLLAAGFIAAALITLIGGEHHAFFPYHMVIGLSLGLMVLLRILWGFVGTHYARFSSFLFTPAQVWRYTIDTLRGRGSVSAGHNAGPAYGIYVMLGLTLGITVTGVLMSRVDGRVRGIKWMHEWLVYALVGMVIIHILGVTLHTIMHKDNITLSMITGRKRRPPGENDVRLRPLVAAVFLAIVGWFTWSLVRTYDVGTGLTRLPIFGTELRMSEGEIE